MTAIDDFWDQIWADQCDGRTLPCPECNSDGDAYYIPAAEVLVPECNICDGTRHVAPDTKAPSEVSA